MLIKEHPHPSNFGVVFLKDGLVRQIVEKPEHSQSLMVSTGIYSLNRDFFTHITGNDMTDAISSMISAGNRIQAIPADDWQNAIFAWDLLKMNRRLLEQILPGRECIASRQTIIQGNVRIGKGTTIGPNTVITGPVVIGDDCTIGPNCCILPGTSIGSRVTIDPLTSLGNVLIMDDTTIGSHSHILDAVIGERCTLADHTTFNWGSGILDIEESAVKAEFGGILGDTVESGPFTLFKHCIIGNNTRLEGRNGVVSRIIPDDSLVI
jgi:glucose-1-phosphate thymidylyltransferase